MIERKILIALITQTEFLRQLKGEWDSQYLESATAQIMANWCWEYFDKYWKAPGRDIENIYIKKLRKGLAKDLAKEIEEDILPGLSEEYENEGINISFILEETRNYFKERQIALHVERLTFLLSKNKIEEAQSELEKFRVVTDIEKDELDLSKPEVLTKIDSAFDVTYQNVIKFPGALGDFLNEQLVRGGLVGLLAPEKRGKTYLLLELMMRAYKQKRKVAFFQAGDMTENQQLIRICIYLARKSNLEKYCGVQYVPIQDCIKNQTNNCNKKVRECNFGIFEDRDENKIRKEITKQELVQAYKDNPDYKPCYNCSEWNRQRWGTVWLKEVEIKTPLGAKDAKKYIKKFFIDTKRSIKISTHVNGTLTISKIRTILQKWKTVDNFTPDVILIDYGDLLETDTKMEERQKQNQIWKGLRALSQEDDCLVIVPTQADAASYSKNRLELENFSEDKRKYAHVTAMYGLNQDPAGREKELGIMRINRIVVREGDFHPSQEVTVLQKLQIGRPYLGSFF
jgi:hypothetical protein